MDIKFHLQQARTRSTSRDATPLHDETTNTDRPNPPPSLDTHPDDESSAFLRGQAAAARWCGADGVRLGLRALRARTERRRSGLALAGAAALALVFLRRGVAEMRAVGGVPLTSRSRDEFDAAAASPAVTGYQARSQVPIPLDYAVFVELSEFAEAVALVRAHRRKNKIGEVQRERRQERRRLGEGDGEEDVTEPAAKHSWEQVAPGGSPETLRAGLKVNHVPFFWHIPRAGGTTVTRLLASCHALVAATSSFSSPALFARGGDEVVASRFRDPTLYAVRTSGERAVNVDLDSFEGVQRAMRGRLIERELAGFLAVPDVRLGSLLFANGPRRAGEGGGETDDRLYKGVLFAMFRDPIERSVSWFYSKQSVKDSVHYDPTLEIYSLADWINSPSYISDYMVRTLVGKVDAWSIHNAVGAPFRPPAVLTRDDLDLAKEILRRKCVVGLLEEKGESMKRFEHFFGWNSDVRRTSLFLLEDEETANAVQAARWKDVKDEECRDRLLHWNWANKNKHPMLNKEEGRSAAATYKLLEDKNRYDSELYMYAKQLFEEQFIQLGFDDNEGDETVP